MHATMVRTMEVAPGIHQIAVGRGPFPGFPAPNVFLITGASASLLVDAGWGDDDDHAERMAAIAEADAPPIAHVLVTHRHADHAGGALKVREATGALVLCHAGDREVIERDRLGGAQVDMVVEGGERFDLGGLSIDILHAPGHTHGCLAAYVPERRALFASDTVMAVSTTIVRPGEGDVADYERTLERFMELDPERIYTGHGPAVADPPRRLRAIADHRREREEALIEAMRDGPRAVLSLRDEVYGPLPEHRQPLAEAQVISMLAKLKAGDRVRSVGDGLYERA